MSTQEAYEKMRAWFSRPNAVFGYDAVKAGCAYRDSQNPKSLKRCALGCLIPNKLYSRDLESYMAVSVSLMGPEIASLFQGVSTSFLSDAQSAHDDEANSNGTIARFIERLDDIARQHCLKVVKS